VKKKANQPLGGAPRLPVSKKKKWFGASQKKGGEQPNGGERKKKSPKTCVGEKQGRKKTKGQRKQKEHTEPGEEGRKRGLILSNVMPKKRGVLRDTRTSCREYHSLIWSPQIASKVMKGIRGGSMGESGQNPKTKTDGAVPKEFLR